MTSDARFWVLDRLSNQQLLASLGMVLRNERQALAALLAHLGEVEERRLHLEAAYGSMFDYCVRRLGMSEDEACRRIELARLARRFPALFPLLASGDLSLSVALVLKPVLSADNHLELLAAARGTSIRQARELVAARFPSPDVASNIRKLPERHSPAPADTAPPLAAPPTTASSANRDRTAPSELECVGFARSPASMPPETRPAETPRQPATPLEPSTDSRPVQNNRIEPLSAQRYKVQFTADLDLKTKLEQARDLLRHTYPNGDFGPIISHALDLLIAKLMRRRFGVGARRKASSSSAGSSDRAASSKPAARSVGCEISATQPLEPTTVAGPSATIQPASAAPSASSRHIPLEARRTVVERDGLGCTWVGADGTRCGCQAWLEIDHRKPRGKGGASEANNLRILCRAHNRLAAEREYGRARVERATARRRAHECRPSAAAPHDATAP